MEMILMVGIAGSGKTTLTLKEYPDHVHISLDLIKKYTPSRKQDILGRFPESGDNSLSLGRKIEQVRIADAISAGKNIVIDDTNLTQKIRKRHIETAKSHNYTVRAILFQNISRAYDQNSKRERVLEKKVLDIHYGWLEYPHEDEGFESIRIIC